jgi:hypothetical protein
LGRATSKAANAAKKAADALPIVERAYVFITHVSAQRIIRENVFEFTITISNVGKTPAIIASESKCGCFISDRYPKHPNIQDAFQRAGAYLAANEPIPWIVTRRITDEDWKKIHAKEIKLLCCGLIVYTDIWKVRHETGFCWEYAIINQTPGFNLVTDSSLNYDT